MEFLQGCLLGHRSTVQSHLSEKKPVMRSEIPHVNSSATGLLLCSLSIMSQGAILQTKSESFLCCFSRFQLQVALHIAASLGHLDLAGWLLERGAHAEEPVGVHPYRQWCHQTAHQDTRKCPIHIAAESSQLLILKLFITNNLLTLACQDPGGRDTLKVAIQRGHRDCVRYLANKLCSVVSLPNMSLPMRIYLQIKRWVSLGQKKAASNRDQYTSAAFKARVGDTLLVDGFNQPNMSSKSRKAVTKPSRRNEAKALQPLPPTNNLLSAPHLPSLQAVSPADCKEMHNSWKQDVKNREEGLLNEIRKDDSSLFRSKFTLPPIREGIPKQVFIGASPTSYHILTGSLKSSSQHGGRTPRENAIYCWTIARSLFFVLYCVFICNKNAS